MSAFEQNRRALAYAGRALMLIGLGVYRAVISPMLTLSMGPACRFEPTCSEYANAAIARHGAIRGGWIALKRLSRCRPGGGWGYDPVGGRSSNASLGKTSAAIAPIETARSLHTLDFSLRLLNSGT